MALSQRVFTDALYDMQRAMAVFDQPFFESFFDNGFVNSGQDNRGRKHQKRGNQNFGRYPATDMVEQPDSYELHAEVPGYDKKDIKIELPDDHTLILSGTVNKERHEASTEGNQGTEKQPESAEKNSQATENQQVVQKKEEDSQVAQYSSPKWWVNERIVGSFTRTFHFPQSVDANQVKASYQDGILKVVVPKNNKNQSRIVNIE